MGVAGDLAGGLAGRGRWAGGRGAWGGGGRFGERCGLAEGLTGAERPESGRLGAEGKAHRELEVVGCGGVAVVLTGELAREVLRQDWREG